MLVSKSCLIIGLLGVLAGTVSAAPTESVSLLAMTLGKAPTLPVCAPPKLAEGCLSLDAAQTAHYKASGMIWYEVPFQGGVAPTFASSDHYLIAVKGGVVQQILLTTKGIAVQTDVMKQLNEKWGWPKAGAPIDEVQGQKRITIKWEFGDKRVVYLGAMDTDPMHGFVSAAITNSVMGAPHL